MKKKLVNLLFSLIVAGLTAVAGIGSYNSHVRGMNINHDTICYTRESENPEMIELTPLPDYATRHEDRYNPYLEWTEEEKDLLVRISQSEAGNQGVTGMALVMRVVLNRVEKNGTDIKTEIFKPGQFAVKGMASGSWENYEALDMVQNGWDESQGAIFFAAGGYNACGDEKLFQYKDHYFSR